MQHMLEKIMELIEKEDPKNPWTDEKIAMELHVAREHITQVRKEYGISDSRGRRKAYVQEVMKMIWEEEGEISERKMTEYMNEKGFFIGKYVIGKYMKEMKLEKKQEINKSINSNKKLEDIKEEKDMIFKRFIGYDGSMSKQIQRAKAAVMYPPNGIHTLIYGPSGVGKSFLADLMFQYAKTTGNFKEDMPFYQFNCADYAENPQLLMAQLFGYCKGAFTGANETKKGIVEQCDGGILFLDEVHRLPPEGQEILFYLMDKGKYRRLGEVEVQRECKVMVIAATTENPESSLLLTFRRRIPMDIEIPPVSDRPWREKLELIQQNFMRECQRLKRKLVVDRNVTLMLMELSYPGNVGQLKSNIQVCCAKAFLECKAVGQEEIHITKEMKMEFEGRGRQRLSKEAIEFCNQDLVFSYNENRMYTEPVYEDPEEYNIYQRLEKQYDSMRSRGVKEDTIEEILSEKIEKELSKYMQQVKQSGYSKEELIGIAGVETVQIATEIYESAKHLLSTLSDQIVFSLAIHLHMEKQRQRNHVSLEQKQMERIKKQYQKEYLVAKEIGEEIGKKYYVEFPEEEILFLAMYFEKFQKKEYEETTNNRINILVVSHGMVASGMLKVANSMMGVQYGESLDFDLTESATRMKETVIQKVKELAPNKGCIILADMGTLVNVEEELEKLPFHVAVIGRTDTLLVIECIRRVLWTEMKMEEIVKELNAIGRAGNTLQKTKINKIKKKAILCFCITGEGSAKFLKSHLSQRLKSNLQGIEIVTKGYIEHETIDTIIREIEEEYEILAIVGTLNLGLEKYETIPYSEVMLPEGIQKLRNIIKRRTRFENNILSEVIQKPFIFYHSEWTEKEAILDEAIGAMVEAEYTTPEFLLSVYKRESMMTTFLKGGIAIPHGTPNLVTKSVISITKLDNPISWDGINMVDIIFVLALKEESKKYFEQLYSIISDETLVAQIRNSKNSSEILKILCKST